jgi:hypothetical protein
LSRSFIATSKIFGDGANEVTALSLQGSFIAEAISLRVEGIASVAISPSQ